MWGFSCQYWDMETGTTHISLQKGQVLTPKMVFEQELLPGVSQTWLYDNWSALGGVIIGNKKFILREKLYASLSGNQQEMANEDQGTRKRVEEVSSSVVSRNVSNELEHQKRSSISRTRATATSSGALQSDHSNEFGFADLV